jgi:uncharacterized ion transporter superfamily protein YfcC
VRDVLLAWPRTLSLGRVDPDVDVEDASVTEQKPAQEIEANELEAVPPKKKQRSFPSALTVLFLILGLVWAAAFFIPSGVYERTPDGDPIPGTYSEIPKCEKGVAGESTPVRSIDRTPEGACIDKSVQSMFQYLWIAPPNGLYGIEDEFGSVSSGNTGNLYGSAEIFLFVLVVGAFITITMRTGAVTAGITRLALRFKSSPRMLIVVLMVIFALGGTAYGMWEETLGFYVLLVALVLAMRFDRMVGAGIIFVGAGTGIIASTVNPFATGVASDAAGIPISEGLFLRVLMWLVLVPVGILYVLWYAKRVEKDPTKSVVGLDPDEAVEEIEDAPSLTGRQKGILVVFLGTFLVMIYGFIPWTDIWGSMFNSDYPLPQMADVLGDFYFTEAAVLFLVAAVLIGIIGQMGERGTVEAITAGAADFLGAALVIVVARSITVIMKNTYIIDTILDWMEGIVSGTSSMVFAQLAFLVNIPIAFLVPSSSGHAALVMPILAPLADFAGVARDLVVTGYQSASGLVNLITPTSAVLMGGLALSKIGYDKYIRFIAPYLAIMFILIVIFIGLGVIVGGEVEPVAEAAGAAASPAPDASVAP